MHTSDLIISESEEHLVKSLEINRVRWFYKEDEVWVPFQGYDSLNLENKYREIDELSSMNINIIYAKNDYVLVRGNMYKASVLKRKLYPIFWIVSDDDGSVSDILRGTWFQTDKYLPLDKESLAEAIELNHLDLFANDKIMKNKTKKNFFQKAFQQLTKYFKLKNYWVNIDGYNIEWIDIDDVFMYEPLKKQYFLGNFGFGRGGTRINRGYHKLASELDKLPEVTHLCFVIPEIGSSWESDECFENVNRLIKICEKLKSIYFSRSENVNNRIEFLVIKWQNRLLYDYHAVDLTIPLHYQDLRKLVNNFAINIFQYANPTHHEKMIQFLRLELNRLYLLFCHYNDKFAKSTNKVSVITESIASVLMFDMLSGRSNHILNKKLNLRDKKTLDLNIFPSDFNLDPDNSQQEVKNPEFHLFEKTEENTQVKRNILFEVHNLFNLGSPLAIFLSLQNEKLKSGGLNEQIFHPGICNKFFNILHPADLTVYRIEPLINANYFTIDPIKIPDSRCPENSYLLNSERILTRGDDPINSSVSEILKSFNLKTSTKENSTEKLIMSLSNIHLPAKDIYEPSTINKRSHLYYQKDTMVIEARNDPNITYDIDTGGDFKTSIQSVFSRRSKGNSGDSDRIKTKNNMNNAGQALLSTTTSDDFSAKSAFIPLKMRIDYELEDRNLETSTSSLLRSCDSYWNSEDLLVFIMNQLFVD